MPRARVLVPARVSRARLCRPGDARGARPRRADGVDIAMARAARAIAARRAIVSFVWSSRVQYTIKYTHVYIALRVPVPRGPRGERRPRERSRDRASRARAIAIAKRRARRRRVDSSRRVATSTRPHSRAEDARTRARTRDDAGIAARDVRGDDARASDARDATSHRDARDGDNARASVNGSARRDGRATRARRTRAIRDDTRGRWSERQRRVDGGRGAPTRARGKTDDDDDDERD